MLFQSFCDFKDILTAVPGLGKIYEVYYIMLKHIRPTV